MAGVIMMDILQDRFRGCLLGLAVGDAVGTTVGFMARGSFPPVTDMVGGGPFGLAPGQWTDDTSRLGVGPRVPLVCSNLHLGKALRQGRAVSLSQTAYRVEWA